MYVSFNTQKIHLEKYRRKILKIACTLQGKEFILSFMFLSIQKTNAMVS